MELGRGEVKEGGTELESGKSRKLQRREGCRIPSEGEDPNTDEAVICTILSTKPSFLGRSPPRVFPRAPLSPFQCQSFCLFVLHTLLTLTRNERWLGTDLFAVSSRKNARENVESKKTAISGISTPLRPEIKQRLEEAQRGSV